MCMNFAQRSLYKLIFEAFVALKITALTTTYTQFSCHSLGIGMVGVQTYRGSLCLLHCHMCSWGVDGAVTCNISSNMRNKAHSTNFKAWTVSEASLISISFQRTARFWKEPPVYFISTAPSWARWSGAVAFSIFDNCFSCAAFARQGKCTQDICGVGLNVTFLLSGERETKMCMR